MCSLVPYNKSYTDEKNEENACKEVLQRAFTADLQYISASASEVEI